MICLPWIIPPLDGVPWSLVCHREEREREKKNPMTDFPLFFLSPLLTYEVKTTTKSTKHGVCVLGKPWSSACPGPCTHPAGAALGARPGPSSRSTCSPGAAWRPRARSRGSQGSGGAWPRAVRARSPPRPARGSAPPASQVPGPGEPGSGVKCVSEAPRLRGELFSQERGASCRKTRARCS